MFSVSFLKNKKYAAEAAHYKNTCSGYCDITFSVQHKHMKTERVFLPLLKYTLSCMKNIKLCCGYSIAPFEIFVKAEFAISSNSIIAKVGNNV